MKSTLLKSACLSSLRFTQTGYSFLLLSFISLFCTPNLNYAMALLALGLACDPFKTDLPWAKRPWWQKAGLVIYPIAVAGLLSFTFNVKS